MGEGILEEEIMAVENHQCTKQFAAIAAKSVKFPLGQLAIGPFSAAVVLESTAV